MGLSTHSPIGLFNPGRAPGPRFPVGPVATFIGCFLLLGLFMPLGAEAAGLKARMGIPVVQLLEQGQDRSVVKVVFPVVEHPDNWQSISTDAVLWGLPASVDRTDPDNPRLLPPEVNVTLAVPTRRAVVTRVLDAAWWRNPDTEPLLNERLVFSPPAPYRSVPITGTVVPVALAGGVLREVTLEILHSAQGEPRRQLALARSASSDPFQVEDPVVPEGVLNGEMYQALARGGRAAASENLGRDKAAPFDAFSLTSNWVRLELTESGVYRVTGQQLSNYGVATGDVDPSKLRVYRGGGLPLDENPELPDTLQFDRAFLHEVALQVLDGGDGEWNLDDELRFYGFGSSAWLDRFTPGATYREFYDHPFSPYAVYWLTWASDAVATPLPGAPLRAAELAAPVLGGTVRDFGRARTHRERQVFEESGLVEDNWTWDNALSNSNSGTYNLREVVPDSAADFTIDVRGHWYSVSQSHAFTVAGYLNQDQANQAQVTFTRGQQDVSRRILIEGRSDAVISGQNLFTVRKLLPAGNFYAALDCFDIYYWARLDLTFGGALEFSHPGSQVPAPGSPVDFEVTGSSPVLWDVTDPSVPFILYGEPQGGGRTRFGIQGDPAVDRHFVALPTDGLLTVDSGQRQLPVSLRASVPAVDYLVVTAPTFGSAAAELASYRSLSLPGVANPSAGVVSTRDIYNNYSGGQKDPRAIRNYLRDVYQQGGQRLKFVCFLGNTSRDFRNYKDRDPSVDLYDFLPTVMRTDFPLYPMPLTSRMPYATDDALVSFDEVFPGDLDFPDLATGRLPASNLSEALGLVDRAIEYDRDSQPGLWRNHVLFTADDCVTFSSWPNPSFVEKAHTDQSEIIAGNLLPQALDLQKTYGVAYPFPPSSRSKSAMRSDINAALNSGTTIFYYVGHGAEDNLADEQIFQSSDINNLGNGMKRPLFTAFSCDVGVFDSPSHLSMAEKFVLGEDGGAIGAICASQVSFSGSNSLMAQSFFSNLYPGRRVDAGRSVAEALMLGKAGMGNSGLRRNSQRYNMLGDPGTVLPHPLDDLGFAAGTSDTLHAATREQAVIDPTGSKALLGPGDSYDLRVEESAFDAGYIYAYAFEDSIDAEGDTIRVQVPRWDTYPQRGGTLFKGNGVAGSGSLEIPFKVPSQLRYGDRARLRLVVTGPDGENSANRILPAVRSETGPIDDVFGPLITMAFEEDRYKVRPGTPLVATLTDTSGIAILGTSPGNSLLLEFDDSGFMTDVTASFAYEPNSFTDGRLSIPLPGDLSLGTHTAALHGSDVLGNVGSDTLSFELAPEGVAGITRVTLFPNPTPGYCRLIFELSDPMEVQWDIYTTSGRRLKTTRRNFAQAGPRILEWDGLDDQGDEIANGTYLYVLRGFGGAEDGRDITTTGKLVIMR